jgi:hypothetical protein
MWTEICGDKNVTEDSRERELRAGGEKEQDHEERDSDQDFAAVASQPLSLLLLPLLLWRDACGKTESRPELQS